MSKIRFRNQPDPLPPASGTGWLYLSPDNSLSFRSYTGDIFSLTSSGISGIIEDTNPALGAALDTNGFGISGGPFIQAVVITGTVVRTAGSVLANNGAFNTLTVSGLPVRIDSLGAGITEVIQDTSPVLGGNLDANLFDISNIGVVDSNTGQFSDSLTISGTPVMVDGLRSVTVSGGPATTGPNINFRGLAGGNVNRVGNTIFFHAPASAAVGGSGITDLVQDSSPQLGGDLDLNGNEIVGSSITISGTGISAQNVSVSGDLTVSGISVPLDRYRTYYFISGAPISNTNAPSAKRLYNNSISYIQKVDLSFCKEIRFDTIQVSAGAASCRIACNGKIGNFSSDVNDYTTVTAAGENGELSIDGNTGSIHKDSGWLPLLPNFRQECYLAVVTSGGNGFTDPSAAQMKITAR